MYQHIIEISAETVTEVIDRANKIMKLIDHSTLHTVMQTKNKYRAIIVCPYNSDNELKKIKDTFINSYLDIKWG